MKDQEQIITMTTTVTTTITTGGNTKPAEKPKPQAGSGDDGQVLPQWA